MCVCDCRQSKLNWNFNTLQNYNVELSDSCTNENFKLLLIEQINKLGCVYLSLPTGKAKYPQWDTSKNEICVVTIFLCPASDFDAKNASLYIY